MTRIWGTAMSDEVADAIANGREYIEKNGWWRGGLFGPNGKQVCLVGGIIRGLGLHSYSDDHDPRVVAAAVAIAPLINNPDNTSQRPVSQVEWWNDKVATDKQAVLDLMAKAEKIERNDGIDPDA